MGCNKMNDNSLFDDNFMKKIRDREETKDWLTRFLKTPILWRNQDYLQTCVMGVNDYNRDNALAIFNRQLKNIYANVVINEKAIEPDEFTDILTIIIKERLYLSSENFKKVKYHISRGFYREYFEHLEPEEEVDDNEIQQMINEIDWGDLD